MSVWRGRRLAAVGPKQTFTITRPAPTEHSGLTTVLPTSEPGTSQISQTVASGDLYLPAGLVSPYLAVILAQVLNNDGSSRTVSWRMVKNGSSVATGSGSVSASNRGAIQAYFSPTNPSGDTSGTGVVAGDVLELRLWAASSTNVQLVYWTYYLLDTRTKVSGCREVADVTINYSGNGASGGYPNLASWPGGGARNSGNPKLIYGDDTTHTSTQIGMATIGGAISPKSAYQGGSGLMRHTEGDLSSPNSAAVVNAASPLYVAPNAITSIVARRVPVV